VVVVVSRGRGTGLDWRREASGRAKPPRKTETRRHACQSLACRAGNFTIGFPNPSEAHVYMLHMVYEHEKKSITAIFDPPRFVSLDCTSESSARDTPLSDDIPSSPPSEQYS